MDFMQSNWAKYGLYYGLISILFQLGSFYFTPINGWIPMLMGFVIMGVMFYLAGKAERDANGGALSYGQALKTTFLTGFIGVVIATLFTIILIQLIDPGLVEKLTEMSVEAARSMMSKFGMPEDQMAEALEKAEESAANSFTPGAMLLSMLTNSIFILIIAALVSIFIKKEEDPNQISVQDIGEV